MTTPLDDIIQMIADEKEHSIAINHCFIYLAALAESRHRGAVSDLFKALPPELPTDCDEKTARRLHQVITDFIETCPGHPNVGYTFHILLHLKVEPDLKSYLIGKLKYYYAQGDAHNVFQICIVLTDMGMDIFRDENGAFMMSRSSCESEINLGVARRFLARLK